MSAQHTAEMIKIAARKPAQNATLIELEGFVELGIQFGSTLLDDLDIKLKPELIEIPASRLVAPKVQYTVPQSQSQGTRRQTSRSVNTKGGTWSIKGLESVEPIPIENLYVVAAGFADDKYNDHNPNILATKFLQALKAHGCLIKNLHKVRRIIVPSGIGSAVENFLLSEMSKFPSKPRPTIAKDVVFFVLPKKNPEIWATLKRWGDTIEWAATECLLLDGKKAKDINDGIFSNLALKLNLKLGGENHRLEAREFSALSTNKIVDTIVLGADVTHPKQSSSGPGSPSIAAVVGSTDGNFVTYGGSMRLQTGGREIIEEIADMVRERLGAWVHVHERVPSSMVFYRDGVSDSQFSSVEREEIAQIEQVWREFWDRAPSCGWERPRESRLKLTFLVVNKRHHTCFYPKDAKASYESWDSAARKTTTNGNVAPGTVVDSVIMKPNSKSFFLQSHHALIGTGRSGYYHVLRNEMNLTLLALEKLTFTFCHVFQRATGSISYCAPAYLADRLCKRGSTYLQIWNQDPNRIPQQRNENMDAYKSRVAEELMVSPLWTRNGQNQNQGRKNPWDPAFDSVMFWL